MQSLTPTTPSVGPPSFERADTPREAAEQFERVLLRRFIDIMTKQLFDSGLAGKKGPKWMQGHRNRQHDMFSKTLTEQLSRSGAINLSELLLRQWNIQPPSESKTAPAGK